MKKSIIFLCFMSLAVPSHSLEFQWPVLSETKTILMKPNSRIPNKYLKRESYFSNFILGGSAGDIIVAPCSGTIIDYTPYSLKQDWFLSYSGSLDEMKQLAQQKGIDKKYIHGSIGIQFETGEKVWIHGFLPSLDETRSVGDFIQKGEVLGTIGFVSNSFPENHIQISLSDKKGKAADIGPYLIGVSFPSVFKKNQGDFDYGTHQFSVSELTESLELLVQSIEQLYPGFGDYEEISEFNTLVSQTKKALNEPLTSDAFFKRILPIINFCRDSHLYVMRTYSQDASQTYTNQTGDFPLSIHVFQDEMFVGKAAENLGINTGATVLSINGVNAQILITKISKYFQTQVGNSQSHLLRCLESNLGATIAFEMGWHPGDVVAMQYLDSSGTQVCKNLTIIEKTPSPETPPQEGLTLINEETALLTIQAIDPTNTACQAWEDFMTAESHKNIENLIIDLRGCPGGDSEYTDQLFSYFNRKPFEIKEKKQITFVGENDLLFHSTNMFPDSLWGFDYSKVSGEWIVMDERSIQPRAQNFTGHLYVLIGGYSASAAVRLAAFIQDSNRGMLFGQEGRSGYYHMNAEKFAKIRLGETGIIANIPLIKSIYKTELNGRIPYGRSIIPDVFVSHSKNSILNNTDEEMAALMHFIQQQKSAKRRLYLIGAFLFLFLNLALVIFPCSEKKAHIHFKSLNMTLKG